MNNISYSSVEGRNGRLVVVRFYPGVDLLEGLLEVCTAHHIQQGCIVTALGSLSKAHLIYAVPDNSRKIGIKYCDPIEVEGPLEFLAASGMVGMNEDQKRATHLHAVLSDAQEKIYGGHLVDKGNIVLATIELVIQEFDGIQLLKVEDRETGFNLFVPKSGCDSNSSN
jgi:predicted DNA-binding protein with PD1-like motif